MPDAQPLATETIPEIIALIGELVDVGHAYAADGDVYFRVASFPGYGALSGQRPDQVEEQEPNPLEGGPARLRALEGDQGGRGHVVGVAVGRGRPGWHIECSAMAAKELGPEFWIHGGGLDLVFPHHENERAQSQAAGHPFARIWMHNGMLRFTGEKMSKSLGNVETIHEVLDGWGAETALALLHDRALAQADRLLGGDDGRRPRAGRDACATRCGASTRAAGDWDELDGGARGRLQHARRARGVPRVGARRARSTSCDAGSRSSGSESLGAVEAAPAEVVALAEARRRPRRAAKDFAEADRLRDEIAAPGGRCATSPSAPFFELVPRRVTRELVYGRNAVREALRGRRAVLELWVERACRGDAGVARRRPAPEREAERELTEAAGSPDHQGVVAWCEPYPYADAWELAAAESAAALPASTRSPTRATSARWSAARPAPARRA